MPLGNDLVRGHRVIIVRAAKLRGATRSFDTYREPVPWTMEVAIFDVASGTFTLPAKVPGGWQSVDMNCCSGWERSTFVRWVSAADARQMLHEASSALRHGAETVVVDEWNEVVSVHGQGLIE